MFKNSVVFLIFCLLSTYSSAQQKQNEVLLSSSSSPNTLFANRFEVGEELFFTVRVDNFIIGEIPALVLESGLALEFDSYVNLLEFYIELDEVNRRYTGWFAKEENSFSLDISELNRKIDIEVRDKVLNLGTEDFAIFGDYLYIKDNALGEVFGISHDYKFTSLELTIIPSEPIPLQQRIARQQSKTRGSGNLKPKFVQLQRSYGIFSPQLLDVNIASNYRHVSKDVDTRYSILGARDIGLVHTNFFFTGNQDDLLDDARLTFSKDSINADLLGSLNASRIEIGDVRPVRQGRESSLNENRGIRITSRNYRDSSNNQLINIEGNIPQGWDAELYRNGLLLDRQLSIATSRYNFLDVPLIFGLNDFEIIMYGPQGQVLVDKVERLIDQKLFSNQGFSYDFSFSQNNTSFLGVNDIKSEKDNYNFSSQFNVGLSETSGVVVGIQREFGGEEDAYVINSGINAILFDSVLANASFSTSNTAESIDLAVRTRLFSQSINSSVALSRPKSGDGNSSFIANAQSVGALNVFGYFSIPMQNQVRMTRNGASDLLQLTSRLGYNGRSFSAFNAVIYNRNDNGELVDEQLSGSLSFQKPFGRIFFRGAINYDIDDGIEPTAYSSAVNWSVSNALKARLNLTHQVINSSTTASFQLGWVHSLFELNSRLAWSDTGSWQGGISARFSLAGKEAKYNSVDIHNRGTTNSGAISVRVFLDSNSNARYDEGEELLPGVKVLATQAFRSGISDENGIATIFNITDKKLTDITVDVDTLPDPFMTPRIGGVSIRFRAGLVDDLDFPITYGSDIEGVVEMDKDGYLYPLKSVQVLLKNNKGEIIDQTKTAYDGFFLFEKIKLGNYHVTLSESLAKKHSSLNLPVVPVRVELDSEFISDISLTLKENPNKTIFISNVGKFTSNKVAQSYFSWLKDKHAANISELFIINSNSLYYIASTASQSKQTAQAHCEILLRLTLACSVEQLHLPSVPSQF